MGDVTRLQPKGTKLDIPCEDVLKNALDADLDEVVIMGSKGDSLFFASSKSRKGDILFLIKLLENYLITAD